MTPNVFLDLDLPDLQDLPGVIDDSDDSDSDSDSGQKPALHDRQLPSAPPKLEPKPEIDALENLIKEDKLVISNTLNTLFPEAEKIFSEIPEDKLKVEIGFLQIPNLNALTIALDDVVTAKGLQFFHGEENCEFGENRIAGVWTYQYKICRFSSNTIDSYR